MIFRRFFMPLVLMSLIVASAGLALAEGRGHRGHMRMENLSAEQREVAERIVAEVKPRIQELRKEVRDKMVELQSFSYRHDEDLHVLSRLGRELQTLRDMLRTELQNLDARLAQEAGLPQRPLRGRSCSNLQQRSLPPVEGHAP